MAMTILMYFTDYGQRWWLGVDVDRIYCVRGEHGFREFPQRRFCSRATSLLVDCDSIAVALRSDSRR